MGGVARCWGVTLVGAWCVWVPHRHWDETEESRKEGAGERERESGSGRAGERERERESGSESGSEREEGESIGSGRVGVGHAVQVMAPALNSQQGTLVGRHGLDSVGGEHVALRVQSLVVKVQREVEAVIHLQVFRCIVDVVRLLHRVGCQSIHLQRQVVVIKPGVESCRVSDFGRASKSHRCL